MYDRGDFPTLTVTSERVRAQTAAEWAELRDDLGAGPALLAELEALAAVPGRRLRIDFERQAVTILEAPLDDAR